MHYMSLIIQKSKLCIPFIVENLVVLNFILDVFAVLWNQNESSTEKINIFLYFLVAMRARTHIWWMKKNSKICN